MSMNVRETAAKKLWNTRYKQNKTWFESQGIPQHPHLVYAGEFEGYEDWMQTQEVDTDELLLMAMYADDWMKPENIS